MVDRFLGSDPGLTRLRGALQAVLTIGLTLEAERLFVHATGALQLPNPGSVPALDQANHQLLVIGLMVGAVVGMISCFGVLDVTPREQLLSMLLIPVPMVAALAAGIALGGHRVLALASIAVVLTLGTYLRRFGPRGMLVGMLLFMGDFFGFFLHGAVGLGDLGWLSAEIGVGLAVGLVVRFGLFWPHPGRTLVRMQRSYAARARGVAASALALFDDPAHGEREARRLRRRLVRLNEAALMIDAQLGQPGSVGSGASSQVLHQRLFDVELALTNLARFAQALTRLELSHELREQVRGGLAAIVGRDTDAARRHAAGIDADLRRRGTRVVIAHRFATSLSALADAIDGWSDEHADGSDEFEPQVALFGGWLPGSAAVSATASQEPWEGRALTPWTRASIQMGIAVTAAIVLGDLLSGRRFYWAVIAAFITFMGANTAGEQIRKALFRVGGTVIGILVGSLLANAVGHDTWASISVVMVALFFAFYLMRVNYAFMVVGITVMVSQLYVQLDEFSNSLLELRLEETALGAGCAVAVILLVLPLRTRRVLRVAMREHVLAVERLVGHAVEGSTGLLRSDARALDATYQAVLATAQPLRRNLFGRLDDLTAQAVRHAAAARSYARNLVFDAIGPLPAADVLRSSLVVVAEACTGPRGGTYVRSGALLDTGEVSMAVRDLVLIDAAMAQLAQLMGLAVTDHDVSLLVAVG